MKTNILIIGMAILLSVNLMGQPNIKGGRPDIELARTAKNQFPDEDVVINQSKVVVDFEYRSKYGVIAFKKIHEHFVSLEKNTVFVYPVFYTDDSRISYYKSGFSSKIGTDNYYTSNNVFHDDVKVKYSTFDLFDFGTFSDIKVDLYYTNIRYLTSIYFNSPIATLEKEIQFIIPSDIEVELIPVNFEGHDISITESGNAKKRIVTYRATNLESMSTDPDLPGRSYLYPHIIVNVKSYVHKDSKEKIFETTDDLYKWYHSLVLDVGNKTDELKPIVSKLITEKQSDEEKIAAIYYWVQDNIRYLAFEDGLAGFKPASCQKVLHNRYGDCKGMANLTKEMLKTAGYDARLVWLGTRHLAYDYTIPSLVVDNHMICAVELNDEMLYLDATEKYNRLGEYAERIQNKNVMVENGDSYFLETIPKALPEQNKQRYKMELGLTDDLTINGKINVSLTGDTKAALMSVMSSIPSKNWEKALKYYLSSGNDLITVTEMKMPELNRDSTYAFSGNLSIADKVSVFDNEAYIYIDPFTFFSDYKLDKDRKYALWFSYKKDIDLAIDFTVPAEWEVISLPESVSIQNDEFIFNVHYQQDENKIKYSMTALIPKAEISAGNLKNWNEAVSKLNKTYGQPIILKKK